MRALVQRVAEASVSVEQQVVGRIEHGALVLLGVSAEDTLADVAYLAGKVSRLRIYSDEEGRMNWSISKSGGAFLVISQFTLYADCRKGNRPGYLGAAPPELAKDLYDHFVATLRELGYRVETGVFQTEMQVSLINDGPVTILIDSAERSLN